MTGDPDYSRLVYDDVHHGWHVPGATTTTTINVTTNVPDVVFIPSCWPAEPWPWERTDWAVWAPDNSTADGSIPGSWDFFYGKEESMERCRVILEGAP